MYDVLGYCYNYLDTFLVLNNFFLNSIIFIIIFDIYIIIVVLKTFKEQFYLMVNDVLSKKEMINFTDKELKKKTTLDLLFTTTFSSLFHLVTACFPKTEDQYQM